MEEKHFTIELRAKKILGDGDILERQDLLTKLKQANSVFQGNLITPEARRSLYKIVKTHLISDANSLLWRVWDDNRSFSQIYNEMGHAQFLRLQGMEDLVSYHHDMREDIHLLSQAVKIARNVETAGMLQAKIENSENGRPSKICCINSDDEIYAFLNTQDGLYKERMLSFSKKKVIKDSATRCFNAAQREARKKSYDLIAWIGSEMEGKKLVSTYEFYTVKPWILDWV